MTGRLPPTASIAEPRAGDRLFAPSAERNAADIVALAERIAPPEGHALELASGTGQHIVALAARLPRLRWTPSEPAPDRRASIRAHIVDSGLGNIADPVDLDACAAGWGARHGPCDLVVLVNLLHLIGTPAARTLVHEAATALAPGGRLMIYGPFMRDGVLTSPGDARFHASLTEADPAIGYKNDADLRDWLQEAGLNLIETVQMPANNLAFVAERQRA